MKGNPQSQNCSGEEVKDALNDPKGDYLIDLFLFFTKLSLFLLY